MIEKFVIDHDTQCEYCGWPIYRWDTAYYEIDTDGVYCCENCAFEAFQDYKEERYKWDNSDVTRDPYLDSWGGYR